MPPLRPGQYVVSNHFLTKGWLATIVENEGRDLYLIRFVNRKHPYTTGLRERDTVYFHKEYLQVVENSQYEYAYGIKHRAAQAWNTGYIQL